MSLATTCPNCSTCFRVVQDQLRVSEGWVRCGHCQQVFNALESLFDLDAPQEPVGLSPAPSGSGRGVWQTEAAARWMKRRDRSPDSGEAAEPVAAGGSPAGSDYTPQASLFAAEQPDVGPSWGHAKREEPLSEDMLAALRAATAEDSHDDADTANDPTDDAAQADEASAEDADETAAPAPHAASADDSEPAPLDDEAAGETAFAPFSVTEVARREPVFEPTRYEPHGFEEAAIEANASPDTAPLPEAPADAATPAEDGGPPSAAMFLSEEAGSQAWAPPPLDDAPVVEPAASAFADEPAEADPTPAPEAPELPSFLAAAERRERWDSPSARWAFGAVAGLLIAGLAAQVAWHWRERLAMAVPVTAGPLATLCQWTGCELGPPREIASLLVDNTALTRPPGSSGYRLTVQLHNTASHPVAAPAFDLVLTDAQGAVVARRTLQPADFDFHDTALAANAEVQWSTEFTLAEGSLVGYTVAAFYP
jgi:predicted Zn finger-like uncharacterized protein